MILESGSPLGKGHVYPQGTVNDPALMECLQQYRRRVIGSYRSVRPTELTAAITGGPYLVSPKIDGELWFLVLEKNGPYLVSPTGRAIAGAIPLLEEVAPIAALASDPVVVVGELFAASSSKLRPRVGDVAAALSGGLSAPVERLGFAAFDLAATSEADKVHSATYSERLERIASLFSNGKRVKAIRTESVSNASEISNLFSELVESGKAEGIIVRAHNGMIYKVKPELTFDGIIIGYTRKTDDPDLVRSLLIGLMHEDGTIQIASACGTLGTDSNRKTLMEKLEPLTCSSSFRYPSSSGEMYAFVTPTLVAEIKVTDLQTELNDGQSIRSMGLTYQDKVGWSATQVMPSASWLHPVFIRIREDKNPSLQDTRFSQLLEYTQIKEAEKATAQHELPTSELLLRRVWTKEAKAKLSVRKLLLWKTNKEKIETSFPAFVVHWTDYSSGRSTPLEREVRIASTYENALTIAENIITENIKKGWTESA